MIDRGLERFVQEQMIATRMPGLSLVLLHGEATFGRHFGFRELRRRDPPTSQTRYGIGSVTKVVTAIAVLQLVAEEQLRLDDPVRLHLPEAAAAFGDATVAHLLAHAAGLPALGWSETKLSDSWFMDGFPVGGYEDLEAFMAGAEAWRTAPPGVRWHYSNEGYILLGRLLERLDGAPYVEAVGRRVLQPLGMARSTFDRDELEADQDRVQPYMPAADGGLVVGANLHGAMPGAGGLVSTPADMARLARLLLRRGQAADGSALVPAALVERMAAAEIAIDGPTPFEGLPLWDDPRRVNGLGLQRHVDVLGHDVWAHGGGVMGGTAYLGVVPTASVGVVVLANAHGYPLAQLALVAVASLLGHPPESLPFVRRQRLLGSLAGTYFAWSRTIRAELLPRSWGFELRFDFRPRPRCVPLVLLDHDDQTGVTRLLALGSGRPELAEVRLDDSEALLVYERYALRRHGGSA